MVKERHGSSVVLCGSEIGPSALGQNLPEFCLSDLPKYVYFFKVVFGKELVRKDEVEIVFGKG